jgi:hypothetical protein
LICRISLERTLLNKEFDVYVSEVLSEEVKSISDKCRELLDLNQALLPQEYFYRSLPLCVIDSVFSIGVKYESVQNTVRRYGEAVRLETKRLTQDYPERKDQQSIDDIVRKMDELGIDFFTDSIFKNKQRTSTRNGILKTEAVYRFCKVLQRFDVNHFQDLAPQLSVSALETAIKEIPGQRSGISFVYFCMLAGEERWIKPDRMIIRFLEQTLNRVVKIDEANELLVAASDLLTLEYPEMSPRLLDYAVWNYTRSQG